MVGRAAGRAFGKWAALGVIGILTVVLGFSGIGFALKCLDPFGSNTVDRTQPALLSAITKLSDYRAASAQFTVVVDVEKDAKWLPGAIRGERTTMLASGSVDAGIDFSNLTNGSINVDETTKRVVVYVPHAELRDPHLDLAKTQVVQHKRGVLDRLGSAIGDAPKGENHALRLAERKLREAAAASDVRTIAEDNTRAMLTSLVQGLGYNDVRVEFVKAAPDASPAL